MGIYPKFVYKNMNVLRTRDIPVFVFHSVAPKYFERQMRYLAVNNYNALTSDELCDVITGKMDPPPKSIALTFDDGRGSLWTTAYPILKGFGLSATCFILPSRIKNGQALSPTLEDVWRGKASLVDIGKRENQEPLCSWQEIKCMHESGVIDFQSHTSSHHSIFISPTIVDFVNPDFMPSFFNSDLHPVVRAGGRDTIADILEWGFPIYEWAPAMSSQKRYVEDELLSTDCIQWVKHNGGKAFFERSGWRNELRERVEDYKKKSESSGRYLSADERFNEIYHDLLQSKRNIEEKLNKGVKHLCYPWYIGSDQSVQASKKAGYESNYWGILGRRATNPIGIDPFYLARINDDYLLTLPGEGRIGLLKLLLDKAIRLAGQKSAFTEYSSALSEL